jgi:signal transduction histidine kinase
MRLKAENALAGDDARRQGALRAVLAQISRLDVLLRDLLDLTHRSAPDRRPTEVAPLLRASAELQQDLAAAHGVALRVLTPGAGLIWPLDPARIGRALDNLVLNAIQSLPPGGQVTLSATVVEGALHLAVADDGPGLPATVRRDLFQPFVTGRADGTGLGLSIVQEIARAHGGEARWRDAAPGTTFTLVLPRGEG